MLCSQKDLNEGKLKIYLEFLLQIFWVSMVQPEGKGFPFPETILLPVAPQMSDPVSLVLLGKSFSDGALPEEIQGMSVFLILTGFHLSAYGVLVMHVEIRMVQGILFCRFFKYASTEVCTATKENCLCCKLSYQR